jgi:hypothetical protein
MLDNILKSLPSSPRAVQPEPPIALDSVGQAFHQPSPTVGSTDQLSNVLPLPTSSAGVSVPFPGDNPSHSSGVKPEARPMAKTLDLRQLKDQLSGRNQLHPPRGDDKGTTPSFDFAQAGGQKSAPATPVGTPNPTLILGDVTPTVPPSDTILEQDQEQAEEKLKKRISSLSNTMEEIRRTFQITNPMPTSPPLPPESTV